MPESSTSYVEYLDILDEEGNLTGDAVSSKEVHEKGLIHRAVHVWLLNSKGQLLVQMRTPNKVAYPNHWDISASGHVSAGESSIDAAKKETEEEIGLTLPDTAFQPLFTIREHVVINDGTYIANEFQDVYLVHLDVLAPELQLQESEVADVRWVDISELKEWLAGKGESIVPHDKEYKELFQHLGY
jgi:isopentenyl-diphosphate delta-isomerase type 1